MAPSSVYTTMTYMANDPLYNTEKPYYVAFAVEEIPEAKHSNHVFEERQVEVHDLQGQLPPKLDQAGFTLFKYPTSLAPEDFEHPELVRSRYFEEIVQLLRAEFPYYSRIVLLDYVHRKRSPAFPSQPGSKTPYAQPLTLPHLDYTPASAHIKLQQIIESDHLQELEQLPYDQLNIWRVLRGPNNDWPLAVCDYQSIDFQNDPLANDIVLKDVPSEDYVLRGNEDHRWYYVSDQEVNDVIVFRNTCSEGRNQPYGWHAAFNPSTAPSPPEIYRESLEMRVFAFIQHGAASPA